MSAAVRGAVLAPLLVLALGCGSPAGGPPAPAGPSRPEDITFAPALAVNLATMKRTGSGLYLQDTKEGEGLTARRTSTVSVRYVGYLPDGTVFDTTGDGEPVVFRLGGREVIPAWNEGIVGMKKGGIRRLVVRPGLAYGSRGRGAVQANATLVFDLQLVDVR